MLERPAAGSYHAWVALPAMEGRAAAIDFTVAPPAGEFERVRTDAAALRQAACEGLELRLSKHFAGIEQLQTEAHIRFVDPEACQRLPVVKPRKRR